jgi:hypothetical protein
MTGWLQMLSLTPLMGPIPLDDSLGMWVILVAVLDGLLDKGTYDDFVQWETFQHTHLAVINILQAGLFSLGAYVGTFERRKMWISQVVTHSF